MGNGGSDCGGDSGSITPCCETVTHGPAEVHFSCPNPQMDCPTPNSGPGVVTVYEGSVLGVGDVTVTYDTKSA